MSVFNKVLEWKYDLTNKLNYKLQYVHCLNVVFVANYRQKDDLDPQDSGGFVGR